MATWLQRLSEHDFKISHDGGEASRPGQRATPQEDPELGLQEMPFAKVDVMTAEPVVRAIRTRQRTREEADKNRAPRDQAPERPVATPQLEARAAEELCDPLVTYCSDELKQAQEKDTDITAMMKLLKDNPDRKPRGRDITHHGREVKGLWTKWKDLKIRDGVLFRACEDRMGNPKCVTWCRVNSGDPSLWPYMTAPSVHTKE